MPSPTLFRLTMGTLLLSLISGCSSETDVLVTLSNLPNSATTVSVSATLDGKPLTGMPASTTLPLNLNQLGLKLPAPGNLALDIQALDSDLCTRAEVKSAVNVAAGLNTLAAPLLPTSPRKCGNLPPCANSMICNVASVPTTNDIQSIWSISPTDIWAVGNAATVLHYDGMSWNAIPAANIPLPSSGITLAGVWASASNDVWAVGTAGKIIHYDGQAWSLSNSGATNTLYGISGINAQDIYTVGDSTLSSSTNPGEFWHWNGSWQQVSQPVTGPLGSVWAINSTFVVVGGHPTTNSGSLLVWNGTKATDYSNFVPTTALHAVWGSDTSHVFAVGAKGSILRYDGVSWTSLVPPFSNTLYGVTGSGSDIYAVGSSGIVAHNVAQSFSNFATGFVGMTLWTTHLPAVGNGIVWLGGVGGFLGYVDSRP